MNGLSKKQILSVTAALALVTGIYLTTDSIAHGPIGGQMMGNQPNMTDYQGMGPGMMMGRQRGRNGFQGMGPGSMMGGQRGFARSQGMGPGMMGGQMGFAQLTTDTAAVDSYLSNIKTQLNISDRQKEAWNNYTETVKAQITVHTDLHNTIHTTTTNQTQLEMNEQHLTAMETMISQKQAVFEAYQALYGTLDATQQEAANQLSWACHS
jgi:hypothetical protein